MTKPFFITGLPCSRTAWLANLFTTGPVFCAHDWLADVPSVEAFRESIHGSTLLLDGLRFIGDSDSGLLACYSQVQRMFPNAPWLLVVRDFDEAWQSFADFAQSGPWKDQLPLTWEVQEEMRRQWDRAWEVMTQNRRVLSATFSNLDNPEALERIWKHLVPGVQFDRRRAEALQKLRVQPMQSKCNIKPALSLVKELWASSLESLPQS